MDDPEDKNGESVDIIVEITGKYGDVVSKLRTPAPEPEKLAAVTSDLSILLDTVIQHNGGTRSAIADQFPPDMDHTYDAEAVVDALQVLEQYDLVILDGNTWYPGPTLRK